MSGKPKKTDEIDDERIESVEEGFKILDDTVKKLSDENISLEESFAVFERGMKVLRDVSEKIDRVEEKVKILSGEGTDDFQ